MTCIVGVAKGGKVYIGADSLGSNGFTKEVRKECKVFKNGDFLLVLKADCLRFQEIFKYQNMIMFLVVVENIMLSDVYTIQNCQNLKKILLRL